MRSEVAPGGLEHHVLNRSVGRMKMFRAGRGFEAFLRVVSEIKKQCPIRILSYCVLPAGAACRHITSRSAGPQRP
jgi:hypothetical protein